jgi:hypothetical protein
MTVCNSCESKRKTATVDIGGVFNTSYKQSMATKSSTGAELVSASDALNHCHTQWN